MQKKIRYIVGIVVTIGVGIIASVSIANHPPGEGIRGLVDVAEAQQGVRDTLPRSVIVSGIFDATKGRDVFKFSRDSATGDSIVTSVSFAVPFRMNNALVGAPLRMPREGEILELTWCPDGSGNEGKLCPSYRKK